MEEQKMHFEFLVEDQSGKKAMEILLPKLFGGKATYRVIPYKGIGRLPKDLKSKNNAAKRILLDQLPRLLRGYGKVPNTGYIIIICDLDDKNERHFLSELNTVLNACYPKPDAYFCLAIEEFEAWYLGDLAAVRKAYPKAKNAILNEYKNDSICGTWELLADAVCKGGCTKLINQGWQAVGKQKSTWAKEISPYMNIDENKSPSFNKMINLLQSIIPKNADQLITGE
jgi:hypothetical protein